MCDHIMIDMEFIGDQDGVTIILMYKKCYKCGSISSPEVKFIENTVH